MSETDPSSSRSEDELTDMTLEDVFSRTPSEETAIHIAETSSMAEIRNQVATLSADIELRRQELKAAQGQLEAVEFALGVYQQAYQLAQDSNPGV